MEREINWKYTGFYGHPYPSKRKVSWELLCRLKDLSSLPWDCGGNFNEILSSSEKFGGSNKCTSVESLIPIRARGERSFHLEPFWVREEDFREIIRGSWQGCMADSQWEIVVMDKIRGLEKEIGILNYREEMYWKHWSRADWLVSGDRNTNYFHAKASSRRRGNEVRCLRRNDGVLYENEADFVPILEDYFGTFLMRRPIISLVDFLQKRWILFFVLSHMRKPLNLYLLWVPIKLQSLMGFMYFLFRNNGML
ncbi:hypothetical protein TorRG33x02_049230 [Trema orientale]|uniref:Endonuclease/exonuclease/phosphatase n=1 Tax=Trema orientale TaxID=63057 RepID=A0A2P5FNQ6_TREOI|nr:hypothetical protein TorRG33x02_049230 [Trema orientale]